MSAAEARSSGVQSLATRTALRSSSRRLRRDVARMGQEPSGHAEFAALLLQGLGGNLQLRPPRYSTETRGDRRLAPRETGLPGGLKVCPDVAGADPIWK